MYFDKDFVAAKLEEATEKAKEFIKQQDPWSQPHIFGHYDRDGKWYVTVRWYSM